MAYPPSYIRSFQGFDGIGNQAKPLSSEKLISLEIGRFIAAGLVLVAHLIAVVNVCFASRGVALFGGWRPGTPLPFNANGVFVYTGELAVQYFFVLSGFVMMTAHHADFGKVGAVWRFWRRRGGRIYPVYWLAVVIALCGGHLPHTSFAQAVQTLLLAPWQTNFIIFPSWSLRFEVAFYLVFGLCLIPRIGKPLLCLWVGFCIWRWCPVVLLQGAHLFSMPLFSLFPPADSNRFASPMEFYFFAGLAAGAIFTWFRPGKLISLLTLAGSCILLLHVLPPLRGGAVYRVTNGRAAAGADHRLDRAWAGRAGAG